MTNDTPPTGATPSATPTPHLFTITVNNNPYQTAAHVLTGVQIKALAGIPADYELFEVRGAETIPVTNEQEVHIHEHLAFRAIPAGTFGVGTHASAATQC